MKTSKSVIESIAVAGLAMALAITAVTGNGVSTVSSSTVAQTQMKRNGIAGVAVVMKEYEQEAAELLRQTVSVEKTDTGLVTASPLTEEEEEWQDKLMAKVDDFLYVRAKADADSEIVGKMYKGDRAVIKKTGKKLDENCFWKCHRVCKK
jgi:cytochrome c556